MVVSILESADLKLSRDGSILLDNLYFLQLHLCGVNNTGASRFSLKLVFGSALMETTAFRTCQTKLITHKASCLCSIIMARLLIGLRKYMLVRWMQHKALSE